MTVDPRRGVAERHDRHATNAGRSAHHRLQGPAILVPLPFQ
ncbi:MAG: hypothetical protein ABI679_04005 [Gemmatimonadota bacterium]